MRRYLLTILSLSAFIFYAPLALAAAQNGTAGCIQALESRITPRLAEVLSGDGRYNATIYVLIDVTAPTAGEEVNLADPLENLRRAQGVAHSRGLVAHYPEHMRHFDIGVSFMKITGTIARLRELLAHAHYFNEAPWAGLNHSRSIAESQSEFAIIHPTPGPHTLAPVIRMPRRPDPAPVDESQGPDYSYMTAALRAAYDSLSESETLTAVVVIRGLSSTDVANDLIEAIGFTSLGVVERGRDRIYTVQGTKRAFLRATLSNYANYVGELALNEDDLNNSRGVVSTRPQNEVSQGLPPAPSPEINKGVMTTSFAFAFNRLQGDQRIPAVIVTRNVSDHNITLQLLGQMGFDSIKFTPRPHERIYEVNGTKAAFGLAARSEYVAAIANSIQDLLSSRGSFFRRPTTFASVDFSKFNAQGRLLWENEKNTHFDILLRVDATGMTREGVETLLRGTGAEVHSVSPTFNTRTIVSVKASRDAAVALSVLGQVRRMEFSAPLFGESVVGQVSTDEELLAVPEAVRTVGLMTLKPSLVQRLRVQALQGTVQGSDARFEALVREALAPVLAILEEAQKRGDQLVIQVYPDKATVYASGPTSVIQAAAAHEIFQGQ